MGIRIACGSQIRKKGLLQGEQLRCRLLPAWGCPLLAKATGQFDLALG